MVRDEFLSELYTPCQRENVCEESGAKLESFDETRGANICLMVQKQPRSEHQSFKIPVAANSCGFTMYFSERP